MENLIRKAAKDLSKAKNVTALTGAGISVESGIPPFRGKGGVWEKIDPMEYAHIDAFLEDPKKIWEVLILEMKTVLDQAQPNMAHKSLAQLEKLGFLKTVITQNVDGLHQMAGNTDVIEFHGNFALQKCIKCNNECPTKEIDISELPPRCQCGGVYRPDCIFFGEMIPTQHLLRSREAALNCDIMIVIGTSAVVHPAAIMPVIAKESGAKVIEINPEKTPLTGSVSDYLIPRKAGRALSDIVEELTKVLAHTDTT